MCNQIINNLTLTYKINLPIDFWINIIARKDNFIVYWLEGQNKI